MDNQSSRSSAGPDAGPAAPTELPRRLVILNRDAFFGVKIGNTLRARRYEVVFTRSTEEFAARLRDQSAPVALGVIDVNAGVDWAVITTLTAAGGPGTPILAFGSHLDVERFRAAKVAGVTRIVSNGDFHRDMVALVERYARR